MDLSDRFIVPLVLYRNEFISSLLCFFPLQNTTVNHSLLFSVQFLAIDLIQIQYDLGLINRAEEINDSFFASFVFPFFYSCILLVESKRVFVACFGF